LYQHWNTILTVLHFFYKQQSHSHEIGWGNYFLTMINIFQTFISFPFILTESFKINGKKHFSYQKLSNQFEPIFFTKKYLSAFFSLFLDQNIENFHSSSFSVGLFFAFLIQLWQESYFPKNVCSTFLLSFFCVSHLLFGFK